MATTSLTWISTQRWKNLFLSHYHFPWAILSWALRIPSIYPGRWCQHLPPTPPPLKPVLMVSCMFFYFYVSLPSLVFVILLVGFILNGKWKSKHFKRTTEILNRRSLCWVCGVVQVLYLQLHPRDVTESLPWDYCYYLE